MKMLNSLSIKNFRALADFTVEKLGQVNLIVGKNNSGKSSVLEALRIYAGNANHDLLRDIAHDHDEQYDSKDYGSDSMRPFEDLFTGHEFPEDKDKSIVIGELGTPDDGVIITPVVIVEREKTVNDETGERHVVMRRIPILFDSLTDDDNVVSEGLVAGKLPNPPVIDFSRHSTSRFQMTKSLLNKKFACQVVPTRYIATNELAQIWDSIALTDAEQTVKQALQIILPEFENLIFIDNPIRHSQRQHSQRFAKVKITGLSKPVPLKSLGDGMLRILQLVLNIFSARDGILLIDEFENGLHYSVQEKVWDLLFKLSKQLNIQIFATTHSWDCVESFANVVINQDDIEGIVFRIGKSVRNSDKGRVISTVFDKEKLHRIKQIDMEIR